MVRATLPLAAAPHSRCTGEREIYRETVSEGERLYSVSSSEDDTVVSFY